MDGEELRSRLRRIKTVIIEADRRADEAVKARDDAFSELLSRLNQKHDEAVRIVQIARYEAVFKSLLKNENEENEEEFGG